MSIPRAWGDHTQKGGISGRSQGSTGWPTFCSPLAQALLCLCRSTKSGEEWTQHPQNTGGPVCQAETRWGRTRPPPSGLPHPPIKDSPQRGTPSDAPQVSWWSPARPGLRRATQSLPAL